MLNIQQKINLTTISELNECRALCSELLEKIKELEYKASYTSNDYLEANHIHATLKELLTQYK